MKLTIFNGSPRGKNSNTTILLKYFTDGFTLGNENEFEISNLVRINDTAANVEKFRQAENIILAFPLYTDAMPGIVKHFIENLTPLKGAPNNQKIGFIVQSGFPEPAHSRFVERYLEKLASRLGCDYLGTIVKGGVEGIKVMPAHMTKKLFTNFFEMGKYFAENKNFSEEILKKLAPRERMSKTRIAGFRVMQKTGLANFYWNGQLKKNNAWEKRFDKPYQN